MSMLCELRSQLETTCLQFGNKVAYIKVSNNTRHPPPKKKGYLTTNNVTYTEPQRRQFGLRIILEVLAMRSGATLNLMKIERITRPHG